jgi:hypothetical protein
MEAPSGLTELFMLLVPRDSLLLGTRGKEDILLRRAARVKPGKRLRKQSPALASGAVDLPNG